MLPVLVCMAMSPSQQAQDLASSSLARFKKNRDCIFLSTRGLWTSLPDIPPHLASVLVSHVFCKSERVTQHVDFCFLVIEKAAHMTSVFIEWICGCACEEWSDLHANALLRMLIQSYSPESPPSRYFEAMGALTYKFRVGDEELVDVLVDQLEEPALSACVPSIQRCLSSLASFLPPSPSLKRRLFPLVYSKDTNTRLVCGLFFKLVFPAVDCDAVYVLSVLGVDTDRSVRSATLNAHKSVDMPSFNDFSEYLTLSGMREDPNLTKYGLQAIVATLSTLSLDLSSPLCPQYAEWLEWCISTANQPSMLGLRRALTSVLKKLPLNQVSSSFLDVCLLKGSVLSWLNDHESDDAWLAIELAPLLLQLAPRMKERNTLDAFVESLMNADKKKGVVAMLGYVLVDHPYPLVTTYLIDLLESAKTKPDIKVHVLYGLSRQGTKSAHLVDVCLALLTDARNYENQIGEAVAILFKTLSMQHPDLDRALQGLLDVGEKSSLLSLQVCVCLGVEMCIETVCCPSQ